MIARPTLVVTNARISTGDPRRPWATALALSGATLAAVGAAAEILKMAAPETQVINANGQTIVLPASVAVGSAVHVTVAADGVICVTSI